MLKTFIWPPIYQFTTENTGFSPSAMRIKLSCKTADSDPIAVKDKKETGKLPSAKRSMDGSKYFSATGYMVLLRKVLKKVSFLNLYFSISSGLMCL